MSFWALFRHRFQAYWRVPFFGRRIFSLVLGGIFALYVGGMLVLFGLLFDDLIGEFVSSRDPLLVASRWLLPLGLGYTALRMVMETGPGLDPRPYQHLPVRRSIIVVFVAVFTLFSAWNALPLIFVATVCVEAAINGAIGEPLRFGLACLALLVATTYLAPMLRQGLSDRPFISIGVGALAVSSVGIEAVNLSSEGTSLLDVSGSLFGGFTQGHVLPLAVASIGMTAIIAGYLLWLRHATFVDHAQRSTSPKRSIGILDRLARRGPVFREAVLELRLLLRNSQGRQVLIVSFAFAGHLAFIGYFVDSWGSMQAPTALSFLNFILFQGVFGTGAFLFLQGNKLFSAEGGWFDSTLTRPVRSRHQIEGKLLLLISSVLSCFMIPLPVLVFSESPFLLFHFSFALYNIGVTSPVILGCSVYNRKSFDLNESVWSSQTIGFSGKRLLLSVPSFGTLLIPFMSLKTLRLQLALVASIGLLSVLFLPLWVRGITNLYRHNRYEMAQGFRSS